MNSNKVSVWVMVAATFLLAAMGCWFCWHCPSRYYWPPHGTLFWRQLAWNVMGLVVFFTAWAVGWKRLLKTAPYLMAVWLAVFVAAQFDMPINGAHRWFSFCLGDFPIRVNVVTIFMPVFALFVAWLHDRKWIRPWMEWCVLSGLVVVVACQFVGSERCMMRLVAFLHPSDGNLGYLYMGEQLQAAIAEAGWFGDAGKSLGFLPCPESDGMMSAVALLFGKWFIVAVVFLFAILGACLSVIWKGVSDASGRRYTLFFGLWLIVPAAYCLLHSLSILPVAGKSPALVGYGGTAVVMAWWGMGVLVAMARDRTRNGQADVKAAGLLCIAAIWGAIAVLSVVLLVVRCKVVQNEGDQRFAEPRLPDLAFGHFGLTAERGRIFAADDSLLAYTDRTWRYYLDPVAVSPKVTELNCRSVPYYYPEIAQGLGIAQDELKAAYKREDSRYVFLKEVEDDSPSVKYFERNLWRLTREAGLIREPVQKRVYTLGSAAVHVVGFMIKGAHTDTPAGAGGLESACNKALAGTNGVYDKKLPEKERYKKAIPKRGADVHTTLVPTLQKSVAEALATACATNGAESAWGLVMKIPSGEIEAMASWPTFDPSMRRDLDKWDASMAVNRAAQTVFEPGGLGKPLTYAIALDSGVLAKDAKINQENGVWEYNGETFRDETTNSVTIAEAIEKRLNIAAGKTACLIGPEKFHSALRRFGFGGKTRTAGISGEESGILVSKPERWDKTTAMRVGMGYGFAATGLQIAQSYATLANHGTLVRPVLIAGEASSCATNGAMQIVSPVAAEAIVRMLKTPMSSTVQMSEHDKENGCPVYSPTNYIASCAGYYPADRPQRVIVVSFVKPRTAHTGDEVAKPVLDAITDAL